MEFDKLGPPNITPSTACAYIEAGIMCGEPKSAHTPEAARTDVAMDHDYVAGTFDDESAYNDCVATARKLLQPQRDKKRVLYDYWGKAGRLVEPFTK